MSENVKWLREIASGLNVGAYDPADNLMASTMNDILRGQFNSAADEIEALQSRLEEVSKAAELISSKDSELRRQNIELRDANRDLRAQFQDIANQTGPRLTKMREERDAALLRLGAATKLIKKVWEYDVVTEGGLLPQDLEREIEAFVIPAVVERLEKNS